ncbi:hypothetical protein [Hahella sp. NBU794]|uniref:hypothetical protein n=1 Tax=Hahella sp. NBU794 TaxID=3422590 RepID=UPI003D6FD012
MFWKKQNKGQNEVELLSDPRPHHYMFAHIAMRKFCESDPLQLFALIPTEERSHLVDFLWSKVCENCDAEGKADFDPGDIEFATLRVKEYPTILMKMPEAKAVAEAMLVAIVLTAGPDMNVENGKPPFRYFTLEHGVSTEGGLRTVMCEWRGDSHANMGDGPEPEASAFLQRVESLV